MFSKILSKHISKYSVLILCFFFIITLQSCPHEEAIFASLEDEEKIETSNFPDKASVLGMARIDNRYYVSTGTRMFERETTSETWDKIKLEQGYSRTSALVQAKVNETAYFIAYEEKDGETSKKALFKITKTGEIKYIKEENNLQTLSITSTEKLFASVALKNEGYNYYDDYEKDHPVLLTEKANGIILDAAEFRNTTYLLAETGLYTVDKNKLTPVEIHNDATGVMLGLLSYNDGTHDTLVVSNKNKIWKTTDGKTWKSHKEKSDSTVFTDIIYINQDAFEGLLVGTRRYNTKGKSDGYREFSFSKKGFGFRKPSGKKYTSGALHKADVLGFFFDEEDEKVFVLTKGSGLWRGSYANTREIDWFLE